MKIFISWSGEVGRVVAEILSTWLPSVIQAAKPFFSPDDVAKGARWSSEIGRELEACQIGIIVVTRESLTAPWIMFEAGALSKNVGKAKVVPILVDLEPSDIRGPLLQFQCAKFMELEIKHVLRMINSELMDLALTDDVLESVFSMWWPSLEKQVSRSLRQMDGSEPANIRTERDILEEVLGLTRSIAQYQVEQRRPQESHAADSIPARRAGTLTLDSVLDRLGSGGNLAGANMLGLNLARLDLSGANLRGANLVRANLSGAKLVNTDFEGANLESVVMDEADLNGAGFSYANLWGASLRNVKNLSSVRSLENANVFEVEVDEDNKNLLDGKNTVSLANYRAFFDHHLNSGMTKERIREVFLWTAHSYPGEEI